jgi:hypothetical protein
MNESIGTASMIVEVEANENCAASLFARFKEAGPPRQVHQVRLYDRNPSAEAPASPAYAQLVEDSGSGVAHLVYGGIYGLRFKPVVVDEPWSLDSSNQWGETHLSLATDRDFRYAP